MSAAVISSRNSSAYAAASRVADFRLLALALALVFIPVPKILAQPAAGDPNTGQQAEIFGDYEDLWRKGKLREALDIVEKQIATISSSYPPRRWLADRSKLKFQLGMVDEAIADMENVERQYGDPAYTLELALMFRYRGKMDRYNHFLDRAWEQARNPRWSNARYSENVMAVGMIAELMGENPKSILGSIYKNLHENRPAFAPGFTAAGDLAYRKGDYALAAEYYGKALAVEDANADARAGLIECYWKSSDPRLDEEMKKLKAAIPTHPRALAIEAELLLDTGKAAEAQKIADAAIENNPNDLRALSLKAAAQFLSDDDAGMEATLARISEFNPVFSEAPRTVGRIASRHYRFREAAEFQQKALALDPMDHEARALLAFDLLRLGDEERGREQLKLAFEGDGFNVQVFNMLKLMDSLSSFETIERGPFLLQIPKKEAPILAEDALALLMEELELYEKKYEIELERPILVQIFDNHDDFMVRSVGLPGSVGYMGICFGRLITMDSPSARAKWTMNWRSVLWHEFVHVVTLQKTKNRMPRWLSEGISVYEETQRSKAWGQRLSADYKPLVDEEKLPGLSDLEKYFTQAKSPSHLMFGYFLSGEFVSFYVEKYGFPALVKSLALIGDRTQTLPALTEAAGVPIERVDQDFQAFLKQRLAPLENLPSMKTPARRTFSVLDGGTSVTLSEMDWSKQPAPFTDAMQKAEEAIKAEKWADAETHLKRAHELFPDYMASDSPLRRLIALYEEQGRREDLKAALRNEIEWNQSDFPASQKLVEILVQEGDWEGVAKEAHWALGIDPFDAPMRRALMHAQRKTGRSAEALASLAQLAILDASRATDYQLERIEVLIAGNDAAAAKRETLALLEEKPHFWKAQELLLRIVEGAPRPDPPPAAPAAAPPGGLRRAIEEVKARAAGPATAPAPGGAQP